MQPVFFRERRPLRLPKRRDAPAGIADYPNVHPLTALVLGRGMATLRDLQEFYSYADALDMAEVIMVNNYNEDLYYEQASKKR